MVKKFILFLTFFMFLGSFIPCFAMKHTYYSEGPLPEYYESEGLKDIKTDDTKTSSEIKKPRAKKIGKTQYPKPKQKSVVSKIGNWLKGTKDTIEGTLAQASEAISQTNNSVSPSNQLPLQNNNDVLNTQENNTQISESEMFNSLIAFPKIDKLLAGLTKVNESTDILAPDYQQEKIDQTQTQPVADIEPALDNKPVEQQEINIMPSGQTITQESTIQPPAALPQLSGPTLASEIYEGTIWVLKKVGRGTVRGIKKTSEWAGWASDKLDELRIGLEAKQKKEKEDLRRQKFIEKFEQVQIAQKARAPNKVNILSQDTKIEDKVLPILPQQIDVQPEVINDIETQIYDIKKDQMQEVQNSIEIDSSDILPQIDTQKLSERPNIEQKIIEQNIADENQSNLQEIEMTEKWSEEPKDEILSSNQEEIKIDAQNKVELFKIFGISCDKKQLMYYGAGVIAIITISGVVAYILYKDGTYKKVGKYIGEHKFAVSGAISAVCALVMVGIYAKQQGMTLQSAGTWITNLFGINRTESI